MVDKIREYKRTVQYRSDFANKVELTNGDNDE